MPYFSCSTFATGARQLVVHDAFERIWCCGRVVLLVIHAHHDRDVRPLRRRRDHDALGAGGDVFGRGIAIGEEPRRLEHDVDAQVLPRKLRRIAERQHLEHIAVDRDAVALDFDLGFQVAEHGVVLQQMGERRGVGQVVHRDEVDVLVAERRPHDVAADAPEPVDADLHSHRCSSDKGKKMTPSQKRNSNVRSPRHENSHIHVRSLQPAHPDSGRDRVAVSGVPGDPLQEVHRQPRTADGLPARVVQPRRRRVDLDSRRVGRRDDDRARADCRSAAAISEPADFSVDDDDGGTAGRAPQRARRRCRVLFPARSPVHRPAHAAPREAAAVRDDGNRDLAEPAASVQADGRRHGDGERPHLVAVVPALQARAAVLPKGPRRRRPVLHADRRVGAARHRHRCRSRKSRRDRQPEIRFARRRRAPPRSMGGGTTACCAISG